jgi:hypothetical protein
MSHVGTSVTSADHAISADVSTDDLPQTPSSPPPPPPPYPPPNLPDDRRGLTNFASEHSASSASAPAALMIPGANVLPPVPGLPASVGSLPLPNTAIAGANTHAESSALKCNRFGVATISELMALIFPQEPGRANEYARLFEQERIGLDTIGYVWRVDAVS